MRARRSAPSEAPRANAPSRYAWHRRVPWVALGAAAVVLVVGVLVAQSLLGLGGGGPGGSTGPGGGIGDHRTDGVAIAYPSYPPTSGPHWPGATSWGFHTEPVPDERAIHNLEHGGVVASYNILAESLAALRAILTTYPKDKFNQVKLRHPPLRQDPAGDDRPHGVDLDRRADHLRRCARTCAFLDGHLNKCCEDVPRHGELPSMTLASTTGRCGSRLAEAGIPYTRPVGKPPRDARGKRRSTA